MLRTTLQGYNIGVSISENFRSDVGEYLSEKYKDELSFILIVNFMRNSFSLRTVREDIDLGTFAKTISPNAGGHKKAAGISIEKGTVWILNQINEEIAKKEEKNNAKNLILKK